MINTIIIDLDGPILDGRLRHYQCYSDILLENGFIPMSEDEYWEMKRNRLDRHKQLEVSGADVIYDRFLKSWLERIEDKEYLVLDRPQLGAVQKLWEWKSAGIKLILITMRNNKSNLDWQLGLFNLLPLFDQAIAVGTHGEAISKADAVKAFVEDTKNGAVLWIGDTETDINAAKMLGVKVCAVSCGLRTHDYLATLKPDFLVHDLNAIDFSEMELT